MKRRSFFGLVSGLMAGCMMPFKAAASVPDHLYCRQLHTVDHSHGIPITGIKWQFRFNESAEWVDTDINCISDITVRWKGTISWKVQYEA